MIEFHGYNLILKHVKGRKRMLEFGNQIMDLQGNQGQTAKDHFTALGHEHTSIDINGKDGALQLDLSVPQPQLFKRFDIITDIGTIEHVETLQGLYECLKNIVNFASEDCIIIHKNPETKSFPFGQGHNCFHWFSLQFWEL